jgi:hypothetical protein
MAPGRRSKCSLISAAIFVGDLAGAEGLHVDRERVRHADGVGHLNFAAVGQAGGHHVLGHPARRVGGAAVDLRRVLAREGAAAVTAHAAVGVDDDLAARSRRRRPSARHDEAAGRVDV